MQRERQMADLFGGVFLLSRRWEALGDRELEGTGVTTKQWMVLVVAGNLFEHPPSLKEVAAVLGTSHQNVRAITNRLVARGLLSLEKDPTDRRVKRLHLTPENQRFWEERGDRDGAFIGSLFQDLDDAELAELGRLMGKVMQRAGALVEG